MPVRSRRGSLSVAEPPAASTPFQPKRVLRSQSICSAKENIHARGPQARPHDAKPLRPLNIFDAVAEEELTKPPRKRPSLASRRPRASESARSSPSVSPRVTRRMGKLSTISQPRTEGDEAEEHHDSLLSSSFKVSERLMRRSTRRIEFDEELCSLQKDASFASQAAAGVDARARLLQLCRQTDAKPFADFFDADTLDGLEKLGEGVYGEVYQSSLRRDVIKVFPVGGPDLVNGETQMDYSDVYSEVYVSTKLTELSFRVPNNRTVNFVQLRKATLVAGRLPERVVQCWHEYERRRGSDNECPSHLPASQEWLVLEFEFGGVPLASMRFSSCREARSVFEQTALSLAAAERALQFEHRDLHWLNILVRPTKAQKLRYKIDGVTYSVQTQGIQVTIIDFTVSRMCFDGNIVYMDLSASPEIFECEGDYQFEIYRLMQRQNGNEWRPFHPHSNILWLHYLLGKLLTETSYPRRDPDQRPVESELRALQDCILDEASVHALVSNSFYFDSCRIG